MRSDRSGPKMRFASFASGLCFGAVFVGLRDDMLNKFDERRDLATAIKPWVTSSDLALIGEGRLQEYLMTWPASRNTTIASKRWLSALYVRF